MFSLVVMMTMQPYIDGKNCHHIALRELNGLAKLAASGGGTLHVPSIFIKAL